MAIPSVIPVRREKGYHTHYIGKVGRSRQFMGFVVATLPEPPPTLWQEHKRWYAVVHLFDGEGKHLETRHRFAGTTRDGEAEVVRKAQRKLAELITGLGSYRWGNIKVGLFQTTIDGQTFGLVDASEPEEGYESVHLLPNGLAFFDPWNGEYDT